MTEPLAHCQEELQALELLTEVQKILANAINSLGKKTPPSIEADYLFHTSLGMNRVVGGFLHLRKAFHVSASKILVRPAIELLIYGSAGLKSKEFHFRKAYSEWREDKRLFAKTPTDEAEAD